MSGFESLFRGRDDAWGADHGEAMRGPIPWRDHLNVEGKSIGVYPIFSVGYDFRQVCVWGCIDLDVRSEGHPAGDYDSPEEAHEAARDLCVAGSALGLRLWPEVTRSNGRHVWAFSQSHVDVPVMRRALLVVCQVADVKATEVNPKQEALPKDSLGNYVRLPYPAGYESAKRRLMYGADNRPYSLTNFLHNALTSMHVGHELQAAADLWVPPPKPVWVPVDLPNLDSTPLHERIGKAGRSIIRDGPLEGSDRSGTLCRLAGICARSGLTQQEAYEMVAEADTRWGKYHLRSDFERRITQIVEIGYR